MKTRLYRITRMALFCCLAAALPAFAQDNQQNQHPEHQRQAQQPEHRAQQPGAQSHARQQANPRPEQRNASHPQAQRQNPQTPNTRPNRGNNHAQQPNRGTRPSPARAQQRPSRQGHSNHGRPAQWGRPPSHRGSYSFRSNDRSRLHSYYMARLRSINRYNRPMFRIGGYFPYADIGYLSPLPPDLYGTLPPPPYGYQMGYYDGYVVVYDPMTYFIASVIDLLQ